MQVTSKFSLANTSYMEIYIPRYDNKEMLLFVINLETENVIDIEFFMIDSPRLSRLPW